MKKIALVSLIVAVTISLCSCGSVASVINQEQEMKKVDETKNTNTYEKVLEEYSVRLQEATPKLIEEYKTEATKNTDGLNGLANLCTDKVSKLAKISTEGTQEMAQIMLDSGSGSYDEYQEWAMKLQDIYMEEATKIQDAYMSSVE